MPQSDLKRLVARAQRLAVAGPIDQAQAVNLEILEMDTANLGALRRLGNYFNKENLESEQAADGTLAALPAQRLVFRGEVEKTSMSGECYSVTHRGLTYWLITWTPTSVASPPVTEELNDLRKRFSFLKKNGEPGKE